ncbi:helix-turn-helix domain-containing protein [Rhizobium metallidurans]|uniref:Transcriptional regulator with XRE-family HTH domain n=1 Tax=Rhizobium metallidurans TaxID=1265931 RepID=A0A7W6G8S8_9HYPH|nr:helix-turn-helix domain-containing protein [Rhizobium metallidurans]MBB3962828.1 transcriptional regulator with XRE-family HTH domain [Rhizobium metallidurans]
MITTAQIRGARAMLGLQQAELADAAGISVADLDRIEHGAEGAGTAMDAVRLALEASGIIFEADGELIAGGPGVRLTRPTTRSFDTVEAEVVQYPEFMKNDAPPGAGG